MPGARLYRTGDRARYRPDGRPGVPGPPRPPGQDPRLPHRAGRDRGGARAATRRCARRSWSRGRIVRATGGWCAYVVVGEAPRPTALRALRCASGCRSYMVPSAFVLLAALPLHPQRQGGPQGPAGSGAAGAGSARLAPRTPVEELLAGIWAEVLGAGAGGGRTDDFFDLGGHSLLATRVVSAGARAPSAWSCRCGACSSADRWRSWRSGSRRRVRGRRGPGAARALVPAPREPETCPSPSPRSASGSSTGSSRAPRPTTCRAAGGAHRPACGWPPSARLCAPSCGRHEVLRTVFPVVDGSPRQRILPDLATGLPVARSRRAAARPVAAPEARAAGRGARRAPLRPGARPAARRAARCAWSADHHRSWSVGPPRDLRRLVALPPGAGDGRPLRRFARAPVAPASCRCSTPTSRVWQREARSRRRWQGELAWWLERLGGEIAPLDLPTDRPRPAVQTYRGAASSRVLPPASPARLAAFGRAQGATLFMTLLAAIAGAAPPLSSGQDDILVGAPVAGRRPWRPRADRLLPEHPGPARRPRRRRARFPRAGWRGCARSPWAPMRTRMCRSRPSSRGLPRTRDLAGRRCSR